MVHLESGAATDVGHVREVNEDACLAADPVFVVADGMGGHQGGEVASSIVVEEFARLGEERYDVRRGAAAVSGALAECQRRIQAYTAEQRASGAREWRTGTTVVAALLCDDAGPGEERWLVANLGDSRAYRLEDDRLAQLTVDHSLVQELVTAGEIDEGEARRHPARHVVTRALGGEAFSAGPDLFELPLGPGRLVLCSDGVSGMLSHAEMARIVGAADRARDAAAGLVEAALAAGGEDNASAVVVDVVG
ncbi:PP2C family protein-serine/threonine phosphatase [Nocardioides donggukensis]|uniref:Serine/threonine-protein phosphatase n=1 Tax=Nocardioides donggukensis TaxID=2774019 RepID=A0A927K686_9ACTN|nr:protein phosphatase 2C domain-containing protein [Nocardioides donggukensis]MBD8868465.1 serine/threonine-protein phosphatase [Nocardioides donggukensis]